MTCSGDWNGREVPGPIGGLGFDPGLSEAASGRPGRPWALVLAAGEGSRVRELTRGADGVAVPKQFCSLGPGPSLLHLAQRRGARLASWERVVTVVAAEHERWWRPALAALPADNVVAQPANRGTAAGVLLPLLAIADRDPGSTVVVLPSDHFVGDEAVLRRALRRALAEVAAAPERVVLLGISPDEADPQLGWIVPGAGLGRRARRVERFVEKPAPPVATELMRDGGLWNSFILAAAAGTLLTLYERRLPALTSDLRRAVAAGDRTALADLYRTLDSADFSRDLMAGSEPLLTVLPVPACGWSDLGTPERVERCAERMDRPARLAPAWSA